jgi:hypothetical protein
VLGIAEVTTSVVHSHRLPSSVPPTNRINCEPNLDSHGGEAAPASSAPLPLPYGFPPPPPPPPPIPSNFSSIRARDAATHGRGKLVRERSAPRSWRHGCLLVRLPALLPFVDLAQQLPTPTSVCPAAIRRHACPVPRLRPSLARLPPSPLARERRPPVGARHCVAKHASSGSRSVAGR